MKGYILLFLFASLVVVTNAPVRLKLNYNKFWELTTPDSAAYIRIGVYDTTNSRFAGPVSDLYLTGKPQMTGFYVGNVKSGDFTSYYDNGTTESVGKFENNLRVGVWKFFHPNG